MDGENGRRGVDDCERHCDDCKNDNLIQAQEVLDQLDIGESDIAEYGSNEHIDSDDKESAEE